MSGANEKEKAIGKHLLLCVDVAVATKMAKTLGSYDVMQKKLEANSKPQVLADVTVKSDTGEIFKEGSLYLFVELVNLGKGSKLESGLRYYRIPSVVANIDSIGVLSKEVKKLLPQLTEQVLKGFVKDAIGRKVRLGAEG